MKELQYIALDLLSFREFIEKNNFIYFQITISFISF